MDFRALLSIGWIPTDKQLATLFRGNSVLQGNTPIFALRNERIPEKKEAVEEIRYMLDNESWVESGDTDDPFPVVYLKTGTSCRESLLSYMEGFIEKVTLANFGEEYPGVSGLLTKSITPMEKTQLKERYRRLYAVRLYEEYTDGTYRDKTLERGVNLILGGVFSKHLQWKARMRYEQEYHPNSDYWVRDSSSSKKKIKKWRANPEYLSLSYKDGILKMYGYPLHYGDLSLIIQLIRDFPEFLLHVGKTNKIPTTREISKALLERAISCIEYGEGIYATEKMFFSALYLAINTPEGRSRPTNWRKARVEGYNGPMSYAKTYAFPALYSKTHTKKLITEFLTPYSDLLYKLRVLLRKRGNGSKIRAIISLLTLGKKVKWGKRVYRKEVEETLKVYF
jgi:hypothetical protein